MKITIIWSSPNTDGLTASAKKAIVRGASSAGASVCEYHLNGKDLEHCRACGNGWGRCASKGACVIRDDFQKLYEELVSSDGIVFVSAVYWHDMTEVMKAFLDRLRRCETAHNGYLSDKRVLTVACAGGTGKGRLECLQRMDETLRHMGMRTYDSFGVIRYNREYMIPLLEQAGEVYVRRLQSGFDMQY